jgi:hypothetical protein
MEANGSQWKPSLRALLLLLLGPDGPAGKNKQEQEGGKRANASL